MGELSEQLLGRCQVVKGLSNATDTDYSVKVPLNSEYLETEVFSIRATRQVRAHQDEAIEGSSVWVGGHKFEERVSSIVMSATE